MKSKYKRPFVKHKNNSGISPDRTVQIIETKNARQKDYPEISVIIPTSDSYRNGLFPALLKQLSQQSFQNFETIIIKGDTRQGRAINTGVDIAKGKYILTLDDDSQLHGNHIFETLMKAIKTDPAIGMAGGCNVIPHDAEPFIKKVMAQIPRRSWKPVKQITDSDLAEHPLLMMKKDVFIKVGGENELIPRGLDPYLRNEFRKAGYRVVVVPGVIYSHLPPSRMDKLIKQFFRNGKQAAFCNKFYPQWVIETPDSHSKNFVEKRPFIYRVARHVVNTVKRIQKRHWIYVIATSVYVAGFTWGYMTYKDKNL